MSTAIRQILQLKITLEHIEPPIWRRFQISNDIGLSDFHEALQVIMGWENCHLHHFVTANTTIGIPDPDFEELETVDETTVRLRDVLVNVGDSLQYEYDFGDGWAHRVDVEKVLSSTEVQSVPNCLDGARACPPEDVGGPFGYLELLEAIADTTHERHTEFVGWIGEDFASGHFSVQEVNNALLDISRRGA